MLQARDIMTKEVVTISGSAQPSQGGTNDSHFGF